MVAAIRRATPDDATACARLFLMAAHGIAEAVYRDLIPGQSTEQIISERRVRPEGRSSSYTNWWLADDGQRNVAGGINIYPLDERGRSAPEELLTEERIKVIVPLIELDALAAGTFFINAVAVFPEYRHGGIARDLIAVAFDEARKAGLTIVTLSTFDEDTRLIEYYSKLGFAIVATRPIVPHECITCAGNLALMSCPVN